MNARALLTTVLSVSASLALAGCCWGPNAKTSGTADAAAAEAVAEAAAPAEAAWPAMPTPGPAPEFSVPESTSFTLANGIPVTLVTTGAVPLVEMRLHVGAGSAADPVGKEGLAAVTADMLNEGAGEMNALDLEQALQRLASDVSLGASLDNNVVRINSLEDKLEPTLELVLSMLGSPTLAQADLDRVIEDRKRSLLSSKDDLPTVGTRVGKKLVFGDSYIGRPGGGNEESLSALTRGDVVKWHMNDWAPANTSLVVVTRMDEATLKPILDATVGTWAADPKSKAPVVEVAPVEPQKGVTVYWVDKPGASQSFLLLGNAAPAFDPATHDLRILGNHPIGGNFTARINMNLREDKGYTYGARSGFRAYRQGGYFAATSSVRADVTAASITEFLKEIRGALGDVPITDEEHGRSVGAMVQAEPGSYERMASVLSQFATADALGYPEGHLQGKSARIAAITREQAQAAYAEVVSGDDLMILVVGDRAVAGPAVEDLGLGAIVAVDDEGNLLEE
ncbi:MAG: insulinase family protein [Deltaproteobacteria bacterium]|nr:insulinase family protein [Deltaproteobacteria bacterium]